MPPSLKYPHHNIGRLLQGFLTAILAIMLAAPAYSASDKLQILASIKPLALIAQEIAGNEVQVETLLPVTASPHDYPLKASDYKHLQDAEVVLWIGAELESFLAKPLARLPSTNIISAYELKGIYWPTSSHEEADTHATHHHTGQDPHLWLDPRNAVVIAEAIAQKLSELQPESATQFVANSHDFKRRMEILDKTLAQNLNPVRSIGFAVYHEGYAHFVAHFNLHQLGYVTYTPERHPGAKHLNALQILLKKEGKCLFMEPQASGTSAQQLARSLNLRIGLLDPIGNNEVTSYTQLLSGISEQFLACLADRADQGNM